MNFLVFDMRRAAVAIILLASATRCFAATDLGVAWADVPIALNVAAARAGGTPLASNGSCRDASADRCRWIAPGEIAFEAQGDGAGHLDRIEADLDTDAHPGGGAAFRTACAAIAALVHPRWSQAQATAAASHTMALTALHGTVDERRQTAEGVILFGDRNVPSRPVRPDGAFLQCGASPDY